VQDIKHVELAKLKCAGVVQIPDSQDCTETSGSIPSDAFPANHARKMIKLPKKQESGNLMKLSQVRDAKENFSFLLLEQCPYSDWKTEKNYRAKVGVDRDTFDFVLNLISDDLKSFHGARALDSKGKELLSNENLLALVLNWIREYPSVRSLSITFKIPASTIGDYVPLLVDILHEKLSQFVTPPARIQRKVETGPLAGAVLFVDSLPIPLAIRPDFGEKESEDRSKYYWFAGGKAQKWAFKIQTTLGLDGEIWNSSRASPYASSDQREFQESPVPEILARNPSYRGIGDSHYAKQKQMIPKRTNPKTKKEELINKEIERVRASIEHTVRRLKTYKIVKGPYRGDRSNLLLVEKIARIVAALINLEIKSRPIQSDLRKWKCSRKRKRTA
jgi:hypothetical protein